MPSHDLFDDHGKSLSSGESAMQPEIIDETLKVAAKANMTRLIIN